MDSLLPFLLLSQETIGAKALRRFLWMMFFTSILINTVTINMEPSEVETMERRGKMCPTVYLFRKESVTEPLLL